MILSYFDFAFNEKVWVRIPAPPRRMWCNGSTRYTLKSTFFRFLGL